MTLLAVAILLLPAHARAASTFREYKLGAPGGPHGMVSGPDGALWSPLAGAGGVSALARLTTAGALSKFPLPPATLVTGLHSGIVAGGDGNLWYDDQGYSDPDLGNPGHRVGRVSTRGAVTTFPIDVSALARGPDGNVWGPTQNGVDRITSSGQVTFFPTATDPANIVDYPLQTITTGPDGALWYPVIHYGSYYGAPSPVEIVRMTTSGSFTYFPLPDSPRRVNDIVAGPDGALWFTDTSQDFRTGAVGRMTVQGQVSTFPFLDGLIPEGITAGPDGAVWVTRVLVPAGFGAIDRITPAGAIREFVFPRGHRPYDIVTGPDRALWFTENIDNAIGSLAANAAPGRLTPASPAKKRCTAKKKRHKRRGAKCRAKPKHHKKKRHR